MVDGWIGSVELDWDDPAYGRMLGRYGRFARVIRYDGRGNGMSDPGPTTLSVLDGWVHDALSVLDAVGSDRCAVIGNGLGGPIAIRLAAEHPERVERLVLTNTLARLRRAVDHPAGLSDDEIDLALAAIRSDWGRGVMLDLYGVGHDEPTRARAARYERLSAPPSVAFDLMQSLADVDVRADLTRITAPTLVIHRANPVLALEHGRGLAGGIPNAIFEEETADDWSWRGETDEDPEGLVRIAEFLTGERHGPDPHRVFAATLFTDIVGSTQLAASLGDRKWRLVIDAHDAETNRQVRRFGGRVVTSTGDGVLALFNAPGVALDCARALRDALSEHEIPIRAGVHAAEIEERDQQVGGIGVHIGARIAALATAGEILASHTVVSLVTGAPYAFADRGTHTLKGVPSEWQVFALTDG